VFKCWTGRHTLILLHMSRTHTRMEVNFKSVEGADNNRGTKGITSAGKTKGYKPNPGPLMHSFIHYQCFWQHSHKCLQSKQLSISNWQSLHVWRGRWWAEGALLSASWSLVAWPWTVQSGNYTCRRICQCTYLYTCIVWKMLSISYGVL
jgi:hypothetical protein